MAKSALPIFYTNLLIEGAPPLTPKDVLYALFVKDLSLLTELLKTPTDLDALAWPPMGTSPKISYTPIQWAVATQNVKAAALLLAAGANPNHFYNYVTAVGLAGYTHQLPMLKLFQHSGANLRLSLLPEHVAENSPDVYSTLLHRIAERPTFSAGVLTDKIKVCLFLAQSYRTDGLDPWPLTISGSSPVTHAIAPVKEALLAWQSQIEAQALNGTLKKGIRKKKNQL